MPGKRGEWNKGHYQRKWKFDQDFRRKSVSKKRYRAETKGDFNKFPIYQGLDQAGNLIGNLSQIWKYLVVSRRSLRGSPRIFYKSSQFSWSLLKLIWAPLENNLSPLFNFFEANWWASHYLNWSMIGRRISVFPSFFFVEVWSMTRF